MRSAVVARGPFDDFDTNEAEDSEMVPSQRLMVSALYHSGKRRSVVVCGVRSLYDVGHHFPAPQRTVALPHRLWRCAVVMFVLSSVAAGGWLMREPALVGAAELWIASGPVSGASAIVVLGGGLETRPFAAAELWRRGLADKILISQGPDERAASIGATSSHSEINREILLKLGVPAGAIQTFGTASKNTRDEAVALRKWAEWNAASGFIIPTEIFPSRRVRWIFRREFSGTAVSIEILSLETPSYTRWDWWKTEQGLLAFQNEFLKYIYYRLKY
jgi:uncharacterized SAM-binding protein YcdF (DUF218 family)